MQLLAVSQNMRVLVVIDSISVTIKIGTLISNEIEDPADKAVGLVKVNSMLDGLLPLIVFPGTAETFVKRVPPTEIVCAAS
jgi:hypothetical protein